MCRLHWKRRRRQRQRNRGRYNNEFRLRSTKIRSAFLLFLPLFTFQVWIVWKHMYSVLYIYTKTSKCVWHVFYSTSFSSDEMNVWRMNVNLLSYWKKWVSRHLTFILSYHYKRFVCLDCTEIKPEEIRRMPVYNNFCLFI